MALHGEDVVMNLFIFFVFADPVDGFTGLNQSEYTAIPTRNFGIGSVALTVTSEPSPKPR